MKTAVIYSGQARSFKRLLWNHHWHVLRKIQGEATYFVSVADDEQADDMLALKEFGSVYFEKVHQPEIPIPIERPGFLGCYPPSSPPQAILRQFWALDRAWTFMEEIAPKENFDRVIRIRPDLAFAEFQMPEVVHPNDCFTPWWATWGGLNDRFAVMGYHASWAYFTTYARIPYHLGDGCPLHPETLLAASMEVYKCHKLLAEFVTVRTDGTIVPMSVTSQDIAHYRA